MARSRHVPIASAPPRWMKVRPHRLHVGDEVLVDLRERLARTRWPEPIPDQGWTYGADVGVVRTLCERWSEYDWREHEARLNARPHFLAEVDGVDLHFWHVPGKGPKPTPLLLLHGWPGSPVEFERLIEPLGDPAAYGGDPADAFDVVVGTLPGFGFGGQPREPGWGVTRMADAFDTLMREALGYDHYGVQGGDIGGLVAAPMGSRHPDALLGLHLNFLLAQPPEDPNAEDEEAAARRAAFDATEFAYAQIQGSKPDSLTVAQSDSPAGLAAWNPREVRSLERGGRRARHLPHRRPAHQPHVLLGAEQRAQRSPVLLRGVARPGRHDVPEGGRPDGRRELPEEPWRVPRRWAEPRFDIRRWTDMPRGGHFGALEEPELLTDDIRSFFRTLRA